VSYVVKKIKNTETFQVWDKELNEPIELVMTQKQANDMARKLNLGSGFEGNIPSFIMRAI